MGKPERLVFDIETNGFYAQTDTLHSLVIKDPATNKIWSGCDHEYKSKDRDVEVLSLDDALNLLLESKEVIGHNIVKYDIPVLRKLKGWTLAPHQEAVDTVILSQLIYTDFAPWDKRLMNEGKLPGKMFGRHSLEAWGYRLTNFKGDFKDLPMHLETSLRSWGAILDKEGCRVLTKACEYEGDDWERVLAKVVRDLGIDVNPFADWSPEMQDYCEQDVFVSTHLWRHLADKDLSFRAQTLEHKAHAACEHIERCGFKYNVEEGERLYGELAVARSELNQALGDTFGSWWAPSGATVTPKKTMYKKLPGFPDITMRRWSEKTGKELKPYVGPPKCMMADDAPYTPLKYVTFNPTSRDDIADRLKKLYGWKPTDFTGGGKPVVDDKTLRSLSHIPAASDLARYFMLDKRIGQLAEGKKAWNSLVTDDGFIKGEYRVLGTVTGRASHTNPNIGQVPAADEKVPYGAEFRSLFGVPKGWGLLGSDLSGLELRCLGHYMAKFDDGAYIKTILEGDVHWQNVLALGLVPPGTVYDSHDPWHNTARNKIAKTFIYAFLYGAGDEKIGSIYIAHKPLTEAQIAKLSKDRKARRMAERNKHRPTPHDVAVIALGSRLKTRFLNATPALKTLRSTIEIILGRREERDGKLWVGGLDGRRLHVRSKHSALNTMLQSAGALLCKQWMILVFDDLVSKGLRPGFATKNGTYVGLDGKEADFAICAWVHDEMQIAYRNEEIKNVIEKSVKAQALKAGRFFKFRAPIEADAGTGPTWKDTH